ncbi:transcriptional repressor [Carnobacteriaceae bacterium zg-ZUI240]|nr:transcriptional repressor [Carnobacteriaceae bacterium zg-ZUI240]
MEDTVHGLREKRKRMTPQRKAILAFMKETKIHPTAQQVYAHLQTQFEKVNLSTVYNNLNALVELGCVIEMTYGDGASRFDYYRKDHEHFHAICRICERVEDFEYEPLDDLANRLHQRIGFIVEEPRLEVFGICQECKEKNDGGKYEKNSRK